MRYLIIIVSLLYGAQLNSQINLVDELYLKIMLENTILFDSIGERLNLDNTITPLFYRTDTLTNSWGEPKEKFVNFEYWPYGISQVVLKIEMDTLTNEYQDDLVNFYMVEYYEDYEIDESNFLFSIKRQNLISLKELDQQINIDKRIVNKINCNWVFESIKFNNHTFNLNSCHFKYKLEINMDGKFNQDYGNREDNCDCTLTNSIIKGERNSVSLNENIFHTLTITSGVIRTSKEKLVLSNEERDTTIEYDFEYISGKLILKNSNNYIITLKKNPACNTR